MRHPLFPLATIIQDSTNFEDKSVTYQIGYYIGSFLPMILLIVVVIIIWQILKRKYNTDS